MSLDYERNSCFRWRGLPLSQPYSVNPHFYFIILVKVQYRQKMYCAHQDYYGFN